MVENPRVRRSEPLQRLESVIREMQKLKKVGKRIMDEQMANRDPKKDNWEKATVARRLVSKMKADLPKFEVIGVSCASERRTTVRGWFSEERVG